VTAPIAGLMMSLTSEFTIAVNAAPMTMPTARSTTLPRIANFLNSSSIAVLQTSGTPGGARRSGTANAAS